MAANKWGDWEMDGHVCFGGQADVFKVRNRVSGELGALKRLGNPNRIVRFEREIQAIKALDHPNIVRLLDAQVSAEPYFAVFEFEAGGSIGQISPQELASIPLELRLAWCEQLASALEVARSKGLVHRDVKTHRSECV